MDDPLIDNGRPDLPRVIASLLALGITNTPSGSINIVEVVPGIATWQFPQPFPPFAVLAIVVGGQPGKTYSTIWKIVDPDNKFIADAAGADVPFTTQIKRVNFWANLQSLFPEPIIDKPGLYGIELWISDTKLSSTPLSVDQINKPPNFSS